MAATRRSFLAMLGIGAAAKAKVGPEAHPERLEQCQREGCENMIDLSPLDREQYETGGLFSPKVQCGNCFYEQALYGDGKSVHIDLEKRDPEEMRKWQEKYG